MIGQLLQTIGGGTQQAPLGPESLLSILMSIALGKGGQPVGQGNAPQTSQLSLQAILPQLLQAMTPQPAAGGGSGAGAVSGGGRPGAGAAQGKTASAGGQQQAGAGQQEPAALTVLKMLGMVR